MAFHSLAATALASLAALCVASCLGPDPNGGGERSQQPSRPAEVRTAAHDVFPVAVRGSEFVDARGQPFRWRGITAFRLTEMIARGRERDVVAYLDWAKSEGLTVVRVLAMAKHLFDLTPEEGRRALPRLLELAKARGIAVEVVALADTRSYTLDYEAHIREIGRIASAHGNAFVELANEPGHPTQDERVHAPAFLQRLATLIPETVVVALGSVEYGEGFAAADYATTHVPRGEAPWDHVLAVPGAAQRAEQLRTPLVSDEPIGAGPKYEPGRRDDDPARFAAAAALTALGGMGATFHYEAGLDARIPSGPEAAALAAWQRGLALASDAPAGGPLLQGGEVASIAAVSGARAVFARQQGGRAMVLLVDPGPAPAIQWAPGWHELRRESIPGVLMLLAESRR